MLSPRNAWAASIQASEKVGCAWIVSPSSCAVNSARIAVVAVAISSVARGPTAAAPSNRSDSGVGDPFDETGRLAGGEALAEAGEAELAGLDRALLRGARRIRSSRRSRLRAR